MFYSISILLMCIFILKKNIYYVIKLNTALFTTHIISNIYIAFLLVFIKYNIQTIMKLYFNSHYYYQYDTYLTIYNYTNLLCEVLLNIKKTTFLK